MNCEVCTVGKREHRLIRYSLTINDQLLVVDHVPASVCDRCGEVTLEPDVVERLQNTIRRPGKPSKVIETPVYEYA
jgi:YgiT-type zinc finger domain-containing protein